MNVLPTFKGYTVDERLGEFRKIIFGEVPEFISFESSKGRNLLSEYRKEQTMKLLPKEVLAKLPPLYSQEQVKDPMVICKFFTPDSCWTWYAIEFDGDDLFFGFVEGPEKELGYFSLRELISIRGPFGLPVERDLYFAPCRLSTIRKGGD